MIIIEICVGLFILAVLANVAGKIFNPGNSSQQPQIWHIGNGNKF